MPTFLSVTDSNSMNDRWNLTGSPSRQKHGKMNKLPLVVNERTAANLQWPKQTPVEHPCVLILHFFASFPSPRNRR